MTTHPQLRRLNRRLDRVDGDDFIVLDDPLMVSEPFAVAAYYEPLLDLIDGRSIDELRSAALLRGLVLGIEDLRAFIGELHEAGVLDDDAFQAKGALEHAKSRNKDETVH